MPWEDGSWRSYFELQTLLLASQRRYVANYEYLIANPTAPCPDGARDPNLYVAALAAIATSEANNNSDTAIIPGTWSGSGNGPEDDPECRQLNEAVQQAKNVVGQLGKCRPGMVGFELSQRRDAWLAEAEARSHRDNKCWSGGNEGHQIAHANAWRQLGECTRLMP